jgi:uncharacterized protein
VAKALIVSDSHGLTDKVAEIATAHDYDEAFHCGDFNVDLDRQPFKRMIAVAGNTDDPNAAPAEQIVEWQGLRFFMTHGHTYNVNMTLMSLYYKARQIEADVVLFGHTHYPLCAEEEGILFINPGSIKEPRGYHVPTYVLLEVQSNEQERQKEETVLTITFYDDQSRPVDELSRTFVR